MNSDLPERRVRRSSNPSEALACWLEAVRRRLAVRSVALADSLGMLVAGAGPARECDELAAWAPLQLHADVGPEGPPFKLSLARVPGFDAYVCAENAALEALATAAAGCSRILAARA
ncbi:MAG: hypothetical protein ACOY0T_24195 [Myxococcota bacterium]